MSKFNSDIKKYKKYLGKNTLVLFFTQLGLWALLLYRINNAIYQSGLPRLLNKPLFLLCALSQKWIEIIYGTSMPHSVCIGSGFYIGHLQLAYKVKIGANVVVVENVTDNSNVVGVPAYIMKGIGKRFNEKL